MRISADIVTPNGIVENSVLEVDEDGRIAGISPFLTSAPEFDFSGALLIPGFIDLHVHGGGNADFMDGTEQAVRTVARTHARFGTTSLLATTLTARRDEIDRAIFAILRVLNAPGIDEAAISGIHVEGPYICSQRRGAQPEKPIRPPDIDELSRWQELAGGNIKQITLAPELTGALAFIDEVVKLGINVSIGHTNATADEVKSAIARGAKMGTHLFNAMSPMAHRKPGAAGALLTEDSVVCELICDGIHVDPSIVKLAVRTKGVDRIVLITDAMSGTAMPDGEYALGGCKVAVRAGTAKFLDGTLAGSVLTMNVAFQNVRHFTLSSVRDASKMSSLNAATLIGLNDRIGSIELGKIADLTVLDSNTGTVEAVFRAGRPIYRR